ncbi:MAG: dihydroorotase [Puniceicoccaceae bacterium 5H]|nr:MAG: dihydroorotase [Puniceicoccaceae bacterium 5H]
MSILWIKNGRVIDPANQRDAVGDVFAVDGRIVAELSAEQQQQAEVIDAGGQIVCPGLVDVHVHLREPGQTHKEDIRSGSRAAAAGGFTTIVCMPNTSPVADNSGTIERIRNSAKANSIVHLYPTGTLTVGMKGEALAPIGSLKQAKVVAVTDDGKCVQNNELMRRAVEYAHMLDLVVMDHCQDDTLTKGAAMNEGEWSMRLGLTGWPAAAEDIIIARNIVLAETTGAHIHMQHVSTKGGVELIREAKKRGIRVSGEAMPHHAFFTDEACKDYNPNFKMNPPLRTAEDREAVIQGVIDGALEIIATDHAPHTDYEKDCEFDKAPFGVIGMETALAVCLEVWHHSGFLELPALLQRMTEQPAKLVGLPAGTLSPDAVADVCIFDPNERWTVDPLKFQSKSMNCPWNGMTLRGRVKHTIRAGERIWDGEQILEPSAS